MDKKYYIETYRNEAPTNSLYFGTTLVDNDSRLSVLDIYWLRNSNTYEIKQSCVLSSYEIDGTDTIISDQYLNLAPGQYIEHRIQFNSGAYSGNTYKITNNASNSVTINSVLSLLSLEDKFDIIKYDYKYSEDINIYTEEDFGLRYRKGTYCYLSDSPDDTIDMDADIYITQNGIIRFYFKPLWEMDDTSDNNIFNVRNDATYQYLLRYEQSTNTIKFYPNYTGQPAVYIESDVLSSTFFNNQDWNYIEVKYSEDNISLQINENIYTKAISYTFASMSDYILEIGTMAYYDDLFILTNNSSWIKSINSEEYYFSLETEIETETFSGVDVTGTFPISENWRLCPIGASNKLPIYRRMSPNQFITLLFKINNDTSGRFNYLVKFDGECNFNDLGD